MQPRVALVTCAQYPTLFEEESGLVSLLRELDTDATPVVWTDPRVRWNEFQRVVIRSVWDYFEKMEAFRAWLSMLEQIRAKVINPVPLIRWNMDKIYLQELEEKGARIVPTLFLGPAARVDLDQEVRDRGWDEVILKPAISGGAFRTHRFHCQRAAELQNELEGILSTGGALLQPFVPEIISEGEWSLFFFGGAYSHAVLKTAKKGDFRIQTAFGGQFSQLEPGEKMMNEARALLELLPSAPLQVRVDGIRIRGQFHLMEIEAIEPYLFTAGHPRALRDYATCIAEDALERRPEHAGAHAR